MPLLETNVSKLELDANRENISALSAFVERFLSAYKIPEERRQKFLMAVDEAITNIVLYAYPDSAGKISVEAKEENGRLEISIVDKGIKFDPTEVPDPELEVPIEERQIGGMGIPLMRRFCDSLRYTRENDSNKLVLVISKD